MASSKSTDLVVSDGSQAEENESARATTRKPDPVEWHQHVWPASGWMGDQFWAALFRHSIDRFHRLVTENNLTHVKVGHVLFVEASYLLTQLGRLDLDAPDDSPPPKPKRKKSPDAPSPRQP